MELGIVSSPEPPSQKDLRCVINYLQWKQRQLSNLVKKDKLAPAPCMELQTGLSMVNSLVYEDLEYLLIKGELYE